MYYILFALLFYFTHRQLYASRHFTGGSAQAEKFIKIISIISLICLIAYGTYLIKIIGIIQVALLIIVSLEITTIINKLTIKLAMKKVLNEGDYNLSDNADQQLLWLRFNWQCDKYATIIALIGVLINSMIILFLLITLFA